VFVGQVGVIAAAQAIDLAEQAEGGEESSMLTASPFLVGFECGVELPAGVDAVVGNADFFDFFEVEQSGQ